MWVHPPQVLLRVFVSSMYYHVLSYIIRAEISQVWYDICEVGDNASWFQKTFEKLDNVSALMDGLEKTQSCWAAGSVAVCSFLKLPAASSRLRGGARLLPAPFCCFFRSRVPAFDKHTRGGSLLSCNAPVGIEVPRWWYVGDSDVTYYTTVNYIWLRLAAQFDASCCRFLETLSISSLEADLGGAGIKIGDFEQEAVRALSWVCSL